ncbi:hypothetical protein CYY_000185 [Polysphondylium violaceum]|uniref:G-protein coupled receptors family 2 profile 2 domain-containing protein n=1 Tax=Polysphondylium violaceum TaxID=133409 RepID=A0A8J4Q4G8_9MYCE|nr:hypothetical protein CYY_000185 [Polysphondylium violaceum]
MVDNICSPGDKEKLSLAAINIIVSALSLIGSLLTIISFLWKRIRTYRVEKEREKSLYSVTNGSSSEYINGAPSSTSKQPTSKLPILIFFLSISDFFTSLFIIISQAYLIGDSESYTDSTPLRYHLNFSPCILFRALIQFFFLSTFFWTTCISYYLYHQLSSPDKENHLMYIFNGISWGIPFAIILGLGLGNHFIMDPTTGWCEVTKTYEFTLWFLPLFICLVLCTVYYIKLRRLFRSKFEYRLQINDRLKQLDSTISRRLTLYIIVFIICWLPDVVQHFISLFSTCSFFPLMILQNILAPSQGFWNFWVYSFTNKVVRIQHPFGGNGSNNNTNPSTNPTPGGGSGKYTNDETKRLLP